jgi:hypothetical protein
MEEIEPVKDWSVSVSGGLRQVNVDSECGIIKSGTQPESASTKS